jgi:hypothetical protein
MTFSMFNTSFGYVFLIILLFYFCFVLAIKSCWIFVLHKSSFLGFFLCCLLVFLGFNLCFQIFLGFLLGFSFVFSRLCFLGFSFVSFWLSSRSLGVFFGSPPFFLRLSLVFSYGIDLCLILFHPLCFVFMLYGFWVSSNVAQISFFCDIHQMKISSQNYLSKPDFF